MHEQPLNKDFFEDHNDSLYGFLFALSVPLSDYCLQKKDPKQCIEFFSVTCRAHPFFIRMSNVSNLITSDEKTRLIMRVTQDFLYGLDEIMCKGCACTSNLPDSREVVENMMVRKYIQRIFSFCDLSQFEQLLPNDLKEIFIDLLHDVMQRKLTQEQAYQKLSVYCNDIDKAFVIKMCIFVNYISCLQPN